MEGKTNILKTIAHQMCPPLVWNGLGRIKSRLKQSPSETVERPIVPSGQDLDLYWDPQFAKVLDTWGEGSTWHEILFLMANCSGKVLDIACGTGKAMEMVSSLPQVTIYGCDISDFLIQKAVDRGITKTRLKVCDATATDYADDTFDYAYSIGSLEHFTDDGITRFVTECYRITKGRSFHMVPVSRSGKDEGWLKTVQRFHNNSVAWWLAKFKAIYPTVYVLDSLWQDNISIGKWFICER